MDRDRKSPGLKLLQGQIWDGGYRSGELRGVVFPDVVPAIRRWHDAGIRVAIYSSGSVHAQRRLFESTAEGDVTPLISAFFDTDIGPKTAPDSYVRIAGALGAAPGRVLFVSDVTAELSAARSAGLPVLLSSRPGNAAQPDAPAFETITGLDQVRPS
jgi:enolase-phosphatase E1